MKPDRYAMLAASSPSRCLWPTREHNAKDRRLRKRSPSSPLSSVASSGAEQITLSISNEISTRVYQSMPSHGRLHSHVAGSLQWTFLGFSHYIPNLNSLSFPETMGSPYQSVVVRADTECSLFSYFAHQFLPSLIHHNAHPCYADFTNKSAMALEHRPLMDAAMACAVLPLSRKAPVDPKTRFGVRKRALAYHSSTVRAIREGLESGFCDGTEDRLLATVILLTLFEVRPCGGIASVASFHPHYSYIPADVVLFVLYPSPTAVICWGRRVSIYISFTTTYAPTKTRCLPQYTL